MSIENILALTTEFNFQEFVGFKTLIDESEGGHEKRDALVDSGLREFKISLKNRNDDLIDSLWDFYIARQGRTDDFLLKIITQFSVVDETIGIGDDTTRQFLLHNFPVDMDGNHSFSINGALIASYVLTNDTANERSYVTFNSAPVLGNEILGSYEYYFRCRFKDDRLSRELFNYKLLNVGMDLIEVRWSTYFPYSGNSSSSSSSSSTSNITVKWYPAFQKGGEASGWDGNSILTQANLVRVSLSQTVTRMSINQMMIYLDTSPGVGKKRVFTLYLNDNPTNMKLTISGGSKSGSVGGLIACEDGDFLYMREDRYNTPPSSNINMGFSVITGDQRRQPIPGGMSQALKHPIFPGVSYDALLSQPYAASSNYGLHSLIPSSGYFRNLRARTPFYLGIGVQTGATGIATLAVNKLIGTDKFVSTDLSVNIQGSNNISFDINNSVRVEDGELFIYNGSWGWGPPGESTNFNNNPPNGRAIDFIPDNPRYGIFGMSYWQNSTIKSTSADLYDSIIGYPAFQSIASRKEIFALFAVPGKIIKMVMWARGYSFQAGFPGIFTIRKNEIDTDAIFTLTNIQNRQTIEPCLSVSAGDRISIKSNQIGANPTDSGGFWLSWIFVPTNGGEWPLFGQFLG